jgi:hypothetical protein
MYVEARSRSALVMEILANLETHPSTAPPQNSGSAQDEVFISSQPANQWSWYHAIAG